MPAELSILNRFSIDNASDAYLNEVFKIGGDSDHITDKMLYNVFHLGFISLLFPNSRMIHCDRDPLDTCLSNYFQNYGGYNGFASDLYDIGHFYRQFHKLMEHWYCTVDLPILKVSYEELVNNQQKVTAKILNFCELDWNSRCMDFHKNARIANTASYNQIRQPMNSTSVTKWKNYEPFLGPLKDALSIE